MLPALFSVFRASFPTHCRACFSLLLDSLSRPTSSSRSPHPSRLPPLQSDVYVYLHKKLDENFDVIADLEEKLEQMEEDNEKLRASSRKELDAARDAAEVRVSTLVSEITSLKDELRSLKEFREQRDAVYGELAQLQRTLEEERASRQAEVAELERRNVAAKDKLKTEMFNKIKETKTVRVRLRLHLRLRDSVGCSVGTSVGVGVGLTWLGGRRVSYLPLQSILLATSDQLHFTTKRTMMENEQIATELTYQVRCVRRYSRCCCCCLCCICRHCSHCSLVVIVVVVVVVVAAAAAALSGSVVVIRCCASVHCHHSLIVRRHTCACALQSREAERVLEANKKLVRENGELRREVQLLEQGNEELAKRTHFFQKLVKKLSEKIELHEEKEKVMMDTGSRMGVPASRVTELEQVCSRG